MNNRRINVYTCEKCGKEHVTVDDEQGATPFMIFCRERGCRSSAYSRFYVTRQDRISEFEWYRPDAKEIAGLDPDMKHYIQGGGLILRPIAKGRERPIPPLPLPKFLLGKLGGRKKP